VYDFNAIPEVREQIAALPDKARPYLGITTHWTELARTSHNGAFDE
jgi:hypothetical protein